MPRPFYHQGKGPGYPLCRRLSRPQGQCGDGGEEKKFPALPRIEP